MLKITLPCVVTYVDGEEAKCEKFDNAKDAHNKLKCLYDAAEAHARKRFADDVDEIGNSVHTEISTYYSPKRSASVYLDDSEIEYVVEDRDFEVEDELDEEMVVNGAPSAMETIISEISIEFLLTSIGKVR